MTVVDDKEPDLRLYGMSTFKLRKINSALPFGVKVFKTKQKVIDQYQQQQKSNFLQDRHPLIRTRFGGKSNASLRTVSMSPYTQYQGLLKPKTTATSL